METNLVLACLAVLVGAVGVLLLMRSQRNQYAAHVGQVRHGAVQGVHRLRSTAQDQCPHLPLLHSFCTQLKPKVKLSKPQAEFKTYTREEVALHNTKEDAWIIIKHRKTHELQVYRLAIRVFKLAADKGLVIVGSAWIHF